MSSRPKTYYCKQVAENRRTNICGLLSAICHLNCHSEERSDEESQNNKFCSQTLRSAQGDNSNVILRSEATKNLNYALRITHYKKPKETAKTLRFHAGSFIAFTKGLVPTLSAG